MKQRAHARHFDSESFELAVRVDDDALVDDVAYGGPLVAHVKGDESSHGETASMGSNRNNQHSNHDVLTANDLVEVTVDEVLLEIGGFGRFQHRSVALGFFLMMVIGVVNLHQIVTERPLVVPFECDENNQLVGTLVDDSSVFGTFQLVCDKTTMRASVSSGTFIGFMLGTIFAGWMTDAHGRKASSIMSCILMVIGTQCWVAPNVTAYMILRLISGMGCGFGMCGVYVCVMELVSRPHRGWIGSIGLNGMWSFGGVVSALVAMNVHQAAVDGTFDLGDTVTEWRAIGLFVAILSFLGLLVVFATTETPTWYLSKGRAADAWDVLDKIAATNGRKGPLPSRETHHLVLVKNQKQNPTEGDGSASADEGRSILALFSTIPICGVPIWRVTLISMLGWFAAGFCYYGTALNMGNLPGEFYSIQVVQLAADIPALLLSVPMLNRLGSRETVAISLVVGGAATFG
jgi:MFS family permease